MKKDCLSAVLFFYVQDSFGREIEMLRQIKKVSSCFYRYAKMLFNYSICRKVGAYCVFRHKFSCA